MLATRFEEIFVVVLANMVGEFGALGRQVDNHCDGYSQAIERYTASGFTGANVDCSEFIEFAEFRRRYTSADGEPFRPAGSVALGRTGCGSCPATALAKLTPEERKLLQLNCAVKHKVSAK